MPISREDYEAIIECIQLHADVAKCYHPHIRVVNADLISKQLTLFMDKKPKLTIERVKGMIENDIATFTENIKLSNSSLEKSKLNYVKYYCKRLLIRLKEINEAENE